MIESQLPFLEFLAAVLANALIPFEDIASGKSDVPPMHTVENGQDDHFRYQDLEIHGVNTILVGGSGELFPIVEIVRGKIFRRDYLGVALVKQTDCAAGTCNLNRYPGPV
jgi:hypothetical protein